MTAMLRRSTDEKFDVMDVLFPFRVSD
jgi:hypothetical protein